MYINDYSISAQDYLELYEKYLTRSPDELLLAAGPINNKRVLDLCAGTLRASNRAKELGAGFVIALDKSVSIIPQTHKADKVIICDVNELAMLKCRNSSNENLFADKVDLIVCQQAVNYWFSDKNIQNVSLLLKDKGHFIFNTFNKCPSVKPTIKQYTTDLYGPHFTEVVQLVNGIVYHLQMREGFVPHYTSFQWLDENQIISTLERYFSNVNITIDNSTTIYVCER